MIHKLQRLKSKRGFTMLELVVVIAIIGIMLAAVLVGGNNRQSRINSANSSASDFYSALQTEFTNFQMFDGPLTMSLNDAYAGKVAGITKIADIGANSQYGGIKYYPAAGGNYPYAGNTLAAETHRDGTPKAAELYLEFHAVNGRITVSWANSMSDLINSNAAPANSELGAVLKQEMEDRIEYSDGYYYAKVSYALPSMAGIANPTKYDYRCNSVKVDWTAYTKKRMTATNSATYMFKSQNLLSNGQVCGVCAGGGLTLGTTGTSFLTAGTPAP